jgi:hypothetical protein
MKQKPLFYDDWKDALRACIQDSGKEWKQVAHHLWPSMKMDSAYAKLKNCLGESGDEKLGVGEALEIMRFCGEYDLLYHLADETSHDRPAQRAAIDKQAELQREYIKAVAAMKKLTDQMARTQLQVAS